MALNSTEIRHIFYYITDMRKLKKESKNGIYSRGCLKKIRQDSKVIIKLCDIWVKLGKYFQEEKQEYQRIENQENRKQNIRMSCHYLSLLLVLAGRTEEVEVQEGMTEGTASGWRFLLREVGGMSKKSDDLKWMEHTRGSTCASNLESPLFIECHHLRAKLFSFGN